jgi:hypothetical protein
MSLSRKILKSVQASLPELRLCDNMLVIPPTRRIARLFLIERTPYKGRFYLWRVVFPLYTPPVGSLRLNYGNRLAGADHVHLDKHAPDKSAELVTRLISESIAGTAKISTPQDFFDHIKWMIGNDHMNFLLDLALTYCVLNRRSEAKAALCKLAPLLDKMIAWKQDDSRLRHITSRKSIERWERSLRHSTDRRRLVDDLLRELEMDLPGLTRRIEAWERENIAQLKLASSVPAPDAPEEAWAVSERGG